MWCVCVSVCEVGCASGRERVCYGVEVSGDDGSRENKTMNFYLA